MVPGAHDAGGTGRSHSVCGLIRYCDRQEVWRFGRSQHTQLLAFTYHAGPCSRLPWGVAMLHLFEGIQLHYIRNTVVELRAQCELLRNCGALRLWLCVSLMLCWKGTFCSAFALKPFLRWQSWADKVYLNTQLSWKPMMRLRFGNFQSFACCSTCHMYRRLSLPRVLHGAPSRKPTTLLAANSPDLIQIMRKWQITADNPKGISIGKDCRGYSPSE